MSKPVQDETVKSYLQRLARANRCAIEDLAPYLAPHTWPHDDAKASSILIASLHDPTNDIYGVMELSALAKATGLPEASLAYALPELRDQYADARSMALCGRNIAGRPNYVGLACHRCMAAKGITMHGYVWMRHDQIVCLRHNLWIGPGAYSAEQQLDLAKVREVVAAQRKHRVLIRRLRRRWVFAVFPLAFEFADSWVPMKTRRQRFARLRAPRGYPPGKFPFRGAHWNAAIYPEAVALTGVLASRRWRSSGLAADDDESLQLIVQQIRSRVLPGYDPDKESEPIFEWLTLLHDHSDNRAEEVRLYERDLLARETDTSQGARKPGSDLCDERADSGKFLVHEGAKAASKILELADQAHSGEHSHSADCMTAITRHREHRALPCAGLGAGRDTREQSHGFVSGMVYRCVVPRTQIVDPHARDSAVVACCLAAGAVSDAAISDRRKAAILMDCLGVLAAISPPGQVMTFGQLRAGLTRPLRELLPATIDLGSTGDVVLLDAEGMLSPEAEDVCHEHFIRCAALDQHWSEARVRAEQEEQRLYLALRDLGAEGYTRARELLTDNPAGDLRALRRKWDELWPRFGNYTPISGWRWAQLNGWWFACPSCHWPMRVIEGDHLATVRCDAHDLRGIRYTAQTDNVGKPPVLQPAGRDAPPVAGQPATSDHLAVSRSVWRYVTLPGVLECELRDHARGLGAQVEMWPDCDSYDVLIEVGSREWRVDAKAWASPDRLADAFRGKSTAAPLYIVLPDHQQWACTALDEQLRAQGYRVWTAGQLMDEVGREARKTR